MNILRQYKLKCLGIQINKDADIILRYIEMYLFNNEMYISEKNRNIYYLKGKTVIFYISPSKNLYVRESIFNVIKQYMGIIDTRTCLRTLIMKHYNISSINYVGELNRNLANDMLKFMFWKNIEVDKIEQ